MNGRVAGGRLNLMRNMSVSTTFEDGVLKGAYFFWKGFTQQLEIGLYC
jgi:hypothetical protein